MGSGNSTKAQGQPGAATALNTAAGGAPPAGWNAAQMKAGGRWDKTNLPAGATQKWVAAPPPVAAANPQMSNRDIWARLLARERSGTLGGGGSSSDRGGYTTSGRGGTSSSSFGGAQRGGGGLY